MIDLLGSEPLESSPESLNAKQQEPLVQLSTLLRAHRRVLVAQRIQNHAFQALIPGVESTYERLHKADRLLALASERYLRLAKDEEEAQGKK